jgi:hypothetical protein
MSVKPLQAKVVMGKLLDDGVLRDTVALFGTIGWEIGGWRCEVVAVVRA